LRPNLYELNDEASKSVSIAIATPMGPLSSLLNCATETGDAKQRDKRLRTSLCSHFARNNRRMLHGQCQLTEVRRQADGIQVLLGNGQIPKSGFARMSGQHVSTAGRSFLRFL